MSISHIVREVGAAGSRLELGVLAGCHHCERCGNRTTSVSSRRAIDRNPPGWEVATACYGCGIRYRLLATRGPEWVGGDAHLVDTDAYEDPDTLEPRLFLSERASSILNEAQLRDYLALGALEWSSLDAEPADRESEEWEDWRDQHLEAAAWILRAAHGLRALARSGQGAWTDEDEALWAQRRGQYLELGGRLPDDFPGEGPYGPRRQVSPRSTS